MNETPEPTKDSSLNNRVTIVDIHMPFGSMVVFMVKWAIASIPAVIILVVLGVLMASVLGGMGGILGGISRAGRSVDRFDSSLFARPALLLETAGEDQREQILRTAIAEAGNDCGEVTHVVRVGTTASGQTIWSASCLGGRDYAVFVSADGAVSIK